MQSKIRDFTKGNISKELVLFSLPFMLTNAAQVIYPVIDMSIVGKVVGNEAFNSISAAGQLFSLFSIIGTGFCTGGQIYIARLSGSGKKDELNKAACHLLLCALAFSIIITGLCFLIKQPMLRFIGVSDKDLLTASGYFTIVSFAFLPIYAYNAFFSVMRGIGRSVSPFIITVSSLLIKIVLDYLLVKNTGLQIKGTAISTLLANTAAFILAAAYFLKSNSGFFKNLRKFKFERKHLLAVIKLGIPLALRSAAVNASMVISVKMVSHLALELKAAFGISIRAEEMLNKFSQGVTFASSSVIGQNHSAGLSGRVKKALQTAWTECFIIYLVVAVFLVLFPNRVFTFFLNEPSVADYSNQFIFAMLVSFPAMIAARGSNGYIQGIGKSEISFMIALLDSIVSRLGLCYLLGRVFNLGYFGYFLGYTVSSYVGAAPGLLYCKYKIKRSGG